MDERIKKLKQKGFISLWKYTENSKNYSGWNFTCNSEGKEFLLELLQMMRHSEWSSNRKISIDPPSQNILSSVNNMGGNANWKTCRGLIISFRNQEDDLWKVEHYNDDLIITCGVTSLNQLHQFIESNSFDVAISDEIGSNILYFWIN